MVSLAFSISISRRPHAPPPYSTIIPLSSPASLQKTYTASTSSSSSSPIQNTPKHTRPLTVKRRGSGCTPLDELQLGDSEVGLLDCRSIRVAEAQRFVKGRGRRVRMSDIHSNDIVQPARRMSYGRGGAGNIRSSFEISPAR